MLQVFTTGGTIDKIYFDALSEFQIGEPGLPNILGEAGVGFDFRVTPLMKKDSLDLTDEDRAIIADAVKSCEQARILITHGTDTMVKTARSLGDIGDKTIVLTGAMQPASLRTTDAIFNVGYAVAAVQLLGPGVYVAMNGQVLNPETAVKDRDAGQFRKA